LRDDVRVFLPRRLQQPAQSRQHLIRTARRREHMQQTRLANPFAQPRLHELHHLGGRRGKPHVRRLDW